MCSEAQLQARQPWSVIVRARVLHDKLRRVGIVDGDRCQHVAPMAYVAETYSVSACLPTPAVIRGEYRGYEDAQRQRMTEAEMAPLFREDNWEGDQCGSAFGATRVPDVYVIC